jgi:hypothetical protein
LISFNFKNAEIIDSCCTHYMISNKMNFKTLHYLMEVQSLLKNQDKIIGIRSISNQNLIIINVYLVDRQTFNLSITKLYDNEYYIKFDSNACHLVFSTPINSFIKVNEIRVCITCTKDYVMYP